MEEIPKDVSTFQDNISPVSNENSPDGSNHIEYSSKKTWCLLHQDSIDALYLN
ncbi:hypothetical protein Syun_024843 [Stephania yunnanensis]|uniref:Uncharacterized protein n=1 Tax=Stephania yunnanensis TaxID=152371 RepID=A0AAP0HQP1_9MAGN